MNWITLLAVATASAIGLYFFIKIRRASRMRYIERYHFHEALITKLSAKHPHLSEPQIELVFQALRQYFHMCNHAGRKMVAMPSQVVDDVWHEFILFTRAYANFCSRAFGRYLHHTPAEAMQTNTVAQDGIKRAWRLACHHEKISPKNPERLPLIFAIDAQLNIPNGFVYTLNCSDKNTGYCASHIGCSAGCAGGSGGFFDGGGSGDAGGCGGGGD